MSPAQKTVLVIEDEEWVNTMLQLLLARNGYRVLAAKTGQAALDLLAGENTHIDLLLTDIVLPETMSGPEFAKKLQVNQPHVKVIYLTGYDAGVVAKDLSPERGDQVVQKPFDSDALLDLIRAVLADK